MKKGISYLVNLAKSRSKTVVTACVVGLTVAQANAAVLTFDPATNAITWDFSDPFTLIMSGVTIAVGLGATIYGIKRAFALGKQLMR